MALGDKRTQMAIDMAFFPFLKDQMHYFRKGILVISIMLTTVAWANTTDESTYFIFDGNPVAVKYTAGRLKQLPIQDAYDLKSITELEAVSMLMRAPHLTLLTTLAQQPIIHISSPKLPEYGNAMFEIFTENGLVQNQKSPTVIWSGPVQFQEVSLKPSYLNTRLKRTLISDSHGVVAPMLDFRHFPPVRRRLKIVGPVHIRNYGRTTVAPHLAFVDITWRIKNLPDALGNHGIDSISELMRVEYIINTRTGKMVFRHTTNDGLIQNREMRLLKEPNGPLLMATTINCSDGGEPLLLDLEHESYGTEHSTDIPPIPHCFPAQ